MKLISSLALMAAFMVGPQTVSAATVFSPPVIADTAAGTGTSAKYYRLAACAWDSTNKAILTSTCGQQTADYFCNSVKGGPAVSFTVSISPFTLSLSLSESLSASYHLLFYVVISDY